MCNYSSMSQLQELVNQNAAEPKTFYNNLYHQEHTNVTTDFKTAQYW